MSSELANTPPIYLDHAATTPVDLEVVEAMMPFLVGPLSYGNPSSIHAMGRRARAAVDTARDLVAQLVRSDYSEVYFTGSGSEADNLALIGTMTASPPGRTHLVTTAIEHHAVLNSAHYLQTRGFHTTLLGVDPEGFLSVEEAAAAMSERTTLVSVMHANNEIGTIQPAAEIAAAAHAVGALFHTDAVQTAGLLDVDFHALGCDLMTLSAHKLYGPKGVGALVIRQGVPVSPMIHGGSQEREKRAGTENVAAIVGFGKAADLALQRRGADAAALERLRDVFIARLLELVPGVRLNGPKDRRLPNNVHVSVEGVEGPTLLMNLDRCGVAASSGSACSSGSIEPSHVLTAIGLPTALASSGIRFSLGRHNTEEELGRAAEIVRDIVLRLLSPRG